ncbi:hypothetical protein ACJIZ3_006454 [Penstemon smallii]|uniref:RING-type domain-containing protein n=1 Tax=Penstemon smallii TaxID=265156 RepID=A0ABD3S7Q3_9LAMI
MFVSYACIRVTTTSEGGEEEREREEERRDFRIWSTNQSGEPIILILGQDKTIVDTYPTFELGQSRRLPKPNNGPCSICLCEYCTNDKLRCIPECNHCFHASCIDEWLKVNVSCPLCRNSPSTTPMSEFVPLAYHSV